MGSLEDRLRALRSAHASKGAAQTRSSGSTSAPQPLCSNDESSALHAGKNATSADAHGNELMSQSKTGDGNEDEIEALIRRTREEVELRRQHGVEVGQDEVEDEDEDEEEAVEGISASDEEFHQLERESKALSSEAQQAVNDLRSQGVLLKPSNEAPQAPQEARPASGSAGEKHTAGAASAEGSSAALERMQRPLPMLERGPASEREEASHDQEGDLTGLEDELAAAMASSPSLGSIKANSSSHLSKLPQDSALRQDTAPADLLQRFQALRTKVSAPLASSTPSSTAKGPTSNPDRAPSVKAASGPSWILPDVPQDIFSALPTVPRDPPPDATSEDVHLRHGIDPERDLSSFSALARLDTKKLSAPGTGPSKGADIKQSKQGNEEEEDMEGWCCICNEDASLQCVGCDSDPYCSQCWAEGHGRMDRDELREHKTVPLEPRWKRNKRRAVMR
ncbi:hypothetical protein IE81DRAFT_140821 [Ceraceosorus guamensis]|uniref:Uncharacterized protein n=1 Tax=Ceraceosorus guamensis TaxID=1522189 RepID=A0A316VZ95_9BASI|nr:hypothetical protein IE81DRAFT_140821 [Ceraceosorus guamensis]PWN42228.1 hypothetical protein IE81DRAFT_140821 [Ceraceosorus guamensis]